jgi:hypothetical protein
LDTIPASALDPCTRATARFPAGLIDQGHQEPEPDQQKEDRKGDFQFPAWQSMRQTDAERREQNARRDHRRFIGDSIDPILYKALGSRNGGEVVNSF